MHKQNLPTKLGHSPLAQALFEIRFKGTKDLSSILTGMVYSEFAGKGITNLGPAELPEFIRAKDPNLRYSVLKRIQLESWFIGIGDNVITLSPNYPYPGWQAFSQKISEIISFLEKQSALIKTVERFSFKYTDIFDHNMHKSVNDTLNLTLKLADENINEQSFTTRLEIPIEDGFHIVQIIGSAFVKFDNYPEIEGILLDIDSIKHVNEEEAAKGLGFVANKLNELHSVNKELFYRLITNECLEKMEPSYA
jgi:uncharacterized protein (TIGR04255 family)